jgi:hypothetical protein
MLSGACLARAPRPLLAEFYFRRGPRHASRRRRERCHVALGSPPHQRHTNPEATENGKKFNLPLAYNAEADQQSKAEEAVTFFAVVFKK